MNIKIFHKIFLFFFLATQAYATQCFESYCMRGEIGAGYIVEKMLKNSGSSNMGGAINANIDFYNVLDSAFHFGMLINAKNVGNKNPYISNDSVFTFTPQIKLGVNISNSNNPYFIDFVFSTDVNNANVLLDNTYYKTDLFAGIGSGGYVTLKENTMLSFYASYEYNFQSQYKAKQNINSHYQSKPPINRESSGGHLLRANIGIHKILSSGYNIYSKIHLSYKILNENQLNNAIYPKNASLLAMLEIGFGF